MAFLLCRHFHSLHNPKNPFQQSEESSLSEQIPLCRFTLEQTRFSLWCPASSSPAHSSYMLVVYAGTQFLCAVGHYYNLNNEHYAANFDIAVSKRQSIVVACCCFRPCAGPKTAQLTRALERYGYEITTHIPVGDIVVSEGEIYGDSPQLV